MLSIFPLIWLCLPVSITALEGAHIEFVTDAFVNNIPSSAILSMLGV